MIQQSRGRCFPFRPGSLLMGMVVMALPMIIPTIVTATQPAGPAIRLPVPESALPPNYRQSVLEVLAAPTLSVSSDEETFPAAIPHYMWMLDHPDRVAKAWRRLGVPALNITSRPDGQHRWLNNEGTELVWRKVAHNEHGLVWYAHGKANAGRVLPSVPARAVAVLWHQSGKDEQGNSIIRHRMDLHLQTDSGVAKVATRVLGSTAPRIAKDGTDQLLFFFSGVARFLNSHPNRAVELLAD